jgi:hypothetical protein
LVDFSTLSINYEFRTSDFFTSASRTNNISFEDRMNWSVRNTYSLDKFLPVTWGVRLPLNLSHSQSNTIPRYRPNSDIRRSNLTPEEREREQNKNMNRSADTSFAMSRTPSNKLLAYTIRNITASARLEERQTSSALQKLESNHYTYRGAYNLTIPQDNIRVRLFQNYHWFFMPRTFNNSIEMRGDATRSFSWRLIEETDEMGWVSGQQLGHQNRNTKTLNTSNEIRYDIFTDMNSTYRLNVRRDQMRENRFQSLNIGTETGRDQDISLSYNPFYMSRFAPTTFNTSAAYREVRSFAADSMKVEGNVNRSIRATIVPRNSDFFTNIANRIGASGQRRYEANRRETESNFETFQDLLNVDDTPDIDIGASQTGRRLSADTSSVPANRTTRPRPPNANENVSNDPRDIRTQRDRETERPAPGNNREQPVPPSTTTEKARPNLLADFFGLLGRVQNVNLTYENTYGSRFRERNDRPEFLYQLGVPHVIDPSGLTARTNSNNFGASTGFPIIRNLNCDTRFSYQVQENFTSTSSTKNTTTVWPDVGLTMTGLERFLKADRFFTRLQASSRYRYTERLSFDARDWNNPNTEALSHDFSPLIDLNGTWVNGMTSRLTVNMQLNDDNNYNPALTNTFRFHQRIIYSGSFGYNFSSEQGMKLPFMSRRVFFTNTMNTDLSVSYETSSRTTKIGDIKTKDSDSTQLTIRPSASYNFHRNLRGGLSGSYSLNADKISRTSLSIFRMDCWVELTF